ncbi:MAG: MarR family winged helix-turn-helix transcriptional regulator [Actinomycetota bacterium]|nr:MarR family winged helix-turn-helix transcriptional regulator [Actinomycetota bacterium]
MGSSGGATGTDGTAGTGGAAAEPEPQPDEPIAPLLAGLGARCAERLARRLAEQGLTPAHVELLGVVADADGPSQQELADRMGVLPSRMVGLIDELEARDLIERVRNRRDRRQYSIRLTDAGQRARADVDGLADEHEAELVAPLSIAERRVLAALLRRLSCRPDPGLGEQGAEPGQPPG